MIDAKYDQDIDQITMGFQKYVNEDKLIREHARLDYWVKAHNEKCEELFQIKKELKFIKEARDKAGRVTCEDCGSLLARF